MSERNQQEAMALLMNCTVFPLAEHELKSRGLVHKLACTIAENNLHAERVINNIIHANHDKYDNSTLNTLESQLWKSWQQKEEAIIREHSNVIGELVIK